MEKNLRLLKESILKSNNKADLDILNELLKEDTSATGGSIGSMSGGDVFGSGTSISGMGSVVNSQPSSFPGALNGNDWINGGGSEGSGDISVPYNPSGGNRMFQKLPAPLSNKKKIKKDKHKNINLPKSQKLMKFSDFTKDEMNKVTRVKE